MPGRTPYRLTIASIRATDPNVIRIDVNESPDTVYRRVLASLVKDRREVDTAHSQPRVAYYRIGTGWSNRPRDRVLKPGIDPEDFAMRQIGDMLGSFAFEMLLMPITAPIRALSGNPLKRNEPVFPLPNYDRFYEPAVSRCDIQVAHGETMPAQILARVYRRAARDTSAAAGSLAPSHTDVWSHYEKFLRRSALREERPPAAPNPANRRSQRRR